MDYKTAGVNVTAGEEFVENLKRMVQSTHRDGVVGGIGLFGGVFDLSLTESTPRLVASTDGVGTKTKIAEWANQYDTIGECLVNHCVNDIAVLGAEPLFLLDTLATDKLNKKRDLDLLNGIIRSCQKHNIALLGGETAELKDVFCVNQFDLGATIIGYLPNSTPLLNGSRIEVNDDLWGLKSTGLHTNGFTLARKVLLEKEQLDPLDKMSDGVSFKDGLLAVHRSYLDLIRSIRHIPDIHGIAHITGGGIIGNCKRLLNSQMGLDVRWGSWLEPTIFGEIRKRGAIPEDSMREAFNLGIGLVIFCDSNFGPNLSKTLTEDCIHIGKVLRK